jgi:hypothetical protein
VWVRAELTGVGSTNISFVPQQTGSQATIVHFNSAPHRLSGGGRLNIPQCGQRARATVSNFTNPAAPTWNASNEIGANFTDLSFTYYDAMGNALAPVSLGDRNANCAR